MITEKCVFVVILAKYISVNATKHIAKETL